MSKITDTITSPGSYELVQSKVLAALQADSTLAEVVATFTSRLPDEHKIFGGHEVPHLVSITERKDQEIDEEGLARIDRYLVVITVTHQGLTLSDIVIDAQRLAAYVELLLEEEGRKTGGMSGLAEAIDGAAGSLIVGAVSTEFFAGRRERGNVYEVESVTICEVELTRPLVGD